MAAPTNIFAGVTTRLYYDESATPLDIDASDVLAGAAVASNLVDSVTEVGDYNPTLNIHEFGVYGTRNSSYLPTNRTFSTFDIKVAHIPSNTIHAALYESADATLKTFIIAQVDPSDATNIRYIGLQGFITTSTDMNPYAEQSELMISMQITQQPSVQFSS